MTFEQALPIVQELVSECSEGERLRLLAWANEPRAHAVQQLMYQRKKGGGPSGDDGGPSGDDDIPKCFTAAIGK